MQTEEKAYWNKDVARILQIGESTVRKWCLELEKNGYVFNRGYKDSRAFLQRDINALTHFKELTKVGSYTLEQAAVLVVERHKQQGSDDITARVPTSEKSSIHAIEESMKRLIELSEEHLKVAREQSEMNRILLNKINERDTVIESQYRYIERLNNEKALTELNGIQHTSDTTTKKEIQKKKYLERFKDFFKH